MYNSSIRNYHYQPSSNVFGNGPSNDNINSNKRNDFSTHRVNEYNNKAGFPGQNPNLFSLNKPNFNKYATNVNQSTNMNLQERAINFGQDQNENMFKKGLRKPTVSTAIQNNSYNIITGAPYSSNAPTKFEKYKMMMGNGVGQTIQPNSEARSGSKGNPIIGSGHSNNLSDDKVDNLFYSYKDGRLSAANNHGGNHGNPRIGNGILPHSSHSHGKYNSFNSGVKDGNNYNTIDAASSMNKNRETIISNANPNMNSNSNSKQLTPKSLKSNNNSFGSLTISNSNSTNKPYSPLHPMSNQDSSHYYTTYNKIPTPNTHSHSNSHTNSPLNPKSYTVVTASSVKEYSYKEDQNIRCRPGMEDMSKVVDKFSRNPDQGLFTLYDGHGGAEVSKYCTNRMPEIFEKIVTSNKDNRDPNYIENCLISTFSKIDEEIKLINCENVGATASVVYILKEKESNNNNMRRVLYSANVGDSRTVLVTNFGAKRLSYDHKATDFSEATRINTSGGVIFAGRVYGQLILSRALGDHSLKKYGVICTPYVKKHIISDKDRFVIVASDGVWDVCSDEDMYRFSLATSNSEEMVSMIVKTSLARGSQDNISCIVIKL